MTRRQLSRDPRSKSMGSHDPEFENAPKFSPEYDDSSPRQRGCFFYGCVIASVLTVLMIIALAVLAFFATRWFSRFVEDWTSPAPMELPRVQLDDQERKDVRERVDAFRKAIDAGTASDPLVLTSDDLNALIEENPKLRGRLVTRVEGDKLKGQISFPLEGLGIAMFKGRYLNGEAELKASLRDGILVVTLQTLEVNGKQPPERFLSELRNQNLAKDAYDNPKNAEMLRRIESLEIKDGKIILKPRLHAESAEQPTEEHAPKSVPSSSEAKPPHAEEPEHQKSAPKTSQPG